MSWFGGGSKKAPEPEKDFLDESAFASDSMSISAPSSGGVSDFQQFSMALQQQMLIQQVISDLSEKAFRKCCNSHKDSQLSGKEVACIHAATNKWLDANEFLLGRLAKKQQAQQRSQFG